MGKITFRNILILFISSCCFSALGTTKNIDPKLKEQSRDWAKKQKKFGFQENKGQMADENGSPVPFVLFKAEAPNLTIWVTNTGITYQFLKWDDERDESKNPDNPLEPSIKDESIKGEWHRVDMVLKGASIKKENVNSENDITQGDVRFYLMQCPQGIFNVKTYTKITIEEVYAGIDWVIYTHNDGLKQDFVVHPNADPDQIKLVYEGSGKFSVKENEIRFENELGKITEGHLLCYQGTETNIVKSNYIVKKNNSLLYLGAGNVPLSANTYSDKQERNNKFSYEIAIKTAEYNSNQTLVIDPQLVWATLYGANWADGPMSIDLDGNNNVYITGYSGQNTFPLQAWLGAYNQLFVGGNDVFILRFTSTGVLTWATFYGGISTEFPNFIVTDNFNNVYVTGWTEGNIPTQVWGSYNQAAFGGNRDAFVLRFTNAGVLSWATCYGGSGWDIGYSIAIDNNDNVYISGEAAVNFPVLASVGAYNQAACAGIYNAFILRFTNAGVRTWATYYGGSFVERGYSIATDGLNNVYLTGQSNSANLPLQFLAGAYYQAIPGGSADIFIARFDVSGVLVWATYYGGSTVEIGFSIASDVSNNIYIVGEAGLNFPTYNRAGAYNQAVYGWGAAGVAADAFVLRFNGIGALTWATYYGGSGLEKLGGGGGSYDHISIDGCGNIYVGFETTSTDIFTVGNSSCGYFDQTYNVPSFGQHFLIKINSVGAILWATYLGGQGDSWRTALGISNTEDLFVTGEWANITSIASYPFTDPGGGAYYDAIFGGTDDGMIVKFSPDTNKTKSQFNSTACPCNGAATMNLTCGDAPYSYVWSNGNSTINSTNASNTITGLCAGTYTVTATSSCNQTQTASFTITGPICGSCALVGQFAKGTANCASCGCKEWIMVNVTGGVSPYTYNWPDGYANRYKNKLCPGVYSINIKDKNGCSINVNLTTP